MGAVDDNHSAAMRSTLLHRRSNLRQEKLQLLKASERIADIDTELALIENDLQRYGHVDPPPPVTPKPG